MLPLTIAQISDLHVSRPGELVFGRIDTAANLRRCIEQIVALPVRPDAIVASGDLVNAGSHEEYRLLRELLAPLPMPVYLVAGNHDERINLRGAFPDHVYLPREGKLHYSVDIDGLRLVMLDTVVPGEDGGALDGAQLAWLQRTLAMDVPTVIFMHHPPCMTGISYMDRIALAAADALKLEKLIERFPNVHGVCCGHVHRSVIVRWGGTTVGVCPSSAFQYVADARAEAVPLTTGEQPAYQLHLWNGTGLITHTLQITAAL